MATIFYERDANPSALKGKTIATFKCSYTIDPSNPGVLDGLADAVKGLLS